MAEVSGVSAQNNEQKFEADSAEWDAQLKGATGDKGGGQNSWRVEGTTATKNAVKATEDVPKNDPNSITDENGQFKPEISKVLNNFIGTMTIEMVKSQSPAQKISMGDDE